MSKLLDDALVQELLILQLKVIINVLYLISCHMKDDDLVKMKTNKNTLMQSIKWETKLPDRW